MLCCNQGYILTTYYQDLVQYRCYVLPPPPSIHIIILWWYLTRCSIYSNPGSWHWNWPLQARESMFPQQTYFFAQHCCQNRQIRQNPMFPPRLLLDFRGQKRVSPGQWEKMWWRPQISFFLTLQPWSLLRFQKLAVKVFSLSVFVAAFLSRIRLSPTLLASA